MTSEQKELFVYIMQSGFACGCSHPYECFYNYIGMIDICSVGSVEFRKAEIKAEKAMVAFLRETKSCPEDSIDELTVEEMYDIINKYYKYYAEKKAK